MKERNVIPHIFNPVSIHFLGESCAQSEIEDFSDIILYSYYYYQRRPLFTRIDHTSVNLCPLLAPQAPIAVAVGSPAALNPVASAR